MSDDAIAQHVSYELDAADLSLEVTTQLRTALPILLAAIEDWRDRGSFTAPGLTAVCATPQAGTVVYSSRWGSGVDNLDRTLVLHTLHTAIERGHEPGLVVACLTAALGPEGRAAAENDARIVLEHGELPLLAVLTAPVDDAGTVAVFATTVAVSVPIEPNATLH
jgi:hypothetical protein